MRNQDILGNHEVSINQVLSKNQMIKGQEVLQSPIVKTLYFLKMSFLGIVCWIFAGVYISLLTIFTILTFGRFIEKTNHIVCQTWGKVLMKLGGFTYEIAGKELALHDQKGIIIFNHSSTLDTLILTLCLPKGGTVIGKKELKYVPFINLAWWSLGFLYLDRKRGVQSHLRMNKYMEKIFSCNRIVMMAPEGTRSPSGIGPFKKGAFVTAMHHQVPIQPLVIGNAGKLWPRSKFLPQQGHVLIEILPPIYPNDWTKENLTEKIAEVRQAMIDCQKKLLSKAELATGQ